MTEPTMILTEPAGEVAGGMEQLHPFDMLMNIIVLLVAPMFLTTSGGDISFARVAALETVKAYRARDQADLLSVAQIIAYGLAGLGSLGLSMADDITLPMILRLRGNANALNRSAEQNRRALKESRSNTSEPNATDSPPVAEPAATAYEASVVASLAETRKRVAEAQSYLNILSDQEDRSGQDDQPRENNQPRLKSPAPPACQLQAPLAPTAGADANLTDQQLKAIWAAGMTEVAAEYTASLTHLPPRERKHATMRAAALNSSANALIFGTTPPPPNSADLAAIVRANRP